MQEARPARTQVGKLTRRGGRKFHRRRTEDVIAGGGEVEEVWTILLSDTFGKGDREPGKGTKVDSKEFRFVAERVGGITAELDEVEQQLMLGAECKEQALRKEGWEVVEALRAGQQV